MANKTGDTLTTAVYTVFIIEAAVDGPNPVWAPVPITANSATKKLMADQNRIVSAGLISLSGVIAYRHPEFAQQALTIVSASSRATQFRLVKIDATIAKSFVTGAAN